MKKQKTGTTKITGIYKITSPVGKVYIGQSTDIQKRWEQYKKHFFKKQYKLYYSIQKYGYESHQFLIIEECGEIHLNLRERFWQDFHNVVEGGLNLTLTNTEEKRKVFSQEIKDKISNTQKGKTLTSEHKQKLSEARKKLPDEIKKANGYANKGRVVSEDLRARISNTMQGITRSEDTKQKMRKPKSESHRLNISLAHTGKPSLIKGVPDEIVTCPHCQKPGGNSGMKRWHFDNCKKKLLL
jgi:group I intron endonuclease